MQRPQGATGVAAVLHLANRAERAVEPEIVGDRLHDLLQRRRDDEDALALFAVALDEAQRLRIHEWTEHRLQRLGDELTQLLGPVAGEDAQTILRTAADGLVAPGPRREEGMPGPRPG